MLRTLKAICDNNRAELGNSSDKMYKMINDVRQPKPVNKKCDVFLL